MDPPIHAERPARGLHHRREINMSRWLLGSLIVGTGLVCGVSAMTPLRAQDKQDKQEKASPSRARDEGEADPAKRIDKALQTYESRADQELDQTRKEIARLRKELGELSELQYDMVISLAELQAEMRAQAALEAEAARSDESPGSGKSASDGDAGRQRLRALELTRELRQVQDSLRGVVQQKRNEVDQIVAQLRDARAMQRQKAERDRNSQAENPSKD